ncbi:hypothetical protein [Xanthobacter sediminis]
MSKTEACTIAELIGRLAALYEGSFNPASDEEACNICECVERMEAKSISGAALQIMMIFDAADMLAGNLPSDDPEQKIVASIRQMSESLARLLILLAGNGLPHSVRNNFGFDAQGNYFPEKKSVA